MSIYYISPSRSSLFETGLNTSRWGIAYKVLLFSKEKLFVS